ncbi:MAG: hypothetical protein N2593_00385 [Patescibacteria group bacterium]|nr:hypothetical protein [Patescibacteria group bacterium]
MDNFNKLISFVLGLVIVIVFFAVVTGKINLGKRTTIFSKKTTITPSPISKIEINENKTIINNKNKNQNTQTPTKNNYYLTSDQKTNPKTIPATGISTFFIPSIFLVGASGWFLKKTGKK